MAYERPNIQALSAYTPGEQPQAGDVVKLNTNENPYPPPAAVLDAIRNVSADQLRRYPPPRAARFRELAARVHGLTPDHVIATNGGDELLRMALTAFCLPARSERAGPSPAPAAPASPVPPGGLGETYPTYSLYDVLAGIHDTPATKVELRDDWSIPHDFASRLIRAGCRLVLVVNPHAPSGRREPLERLEAIARELRGHAVLLIDEAYVDFADADALPLLDPDLPGGALDNVLLLRTLSKGYSLAGLRFGYGLGHPSLIAALDKVRDSYNTDALAQAAAIAALEHRDAARQSWQKVTAERARLTRELTRRGFNVPPSQSNFVLASVGASMPMSAAGIYQALHDQNIFIRYWNAPRLSDKLRITIGTPEENDTLLRALDRLLQAPPAPSATRHPQSAI